MAWIYFQVLEGSDSHYRLGSEPFVIANETDTHKAFFCPECDQVTLIRPLFGMTSQHYERSCCLESTLSQEAFRARISALQAVERAWTESEAAYSTKLSAWSKSSHPDSSFWKTCQPSELAVFLKSSMPLQKSGMIVDGLVYLPQMLERHTSAKDGFSWPTPTASDHLHNQSEMLENWQKRAEEKKKQGINLQFALRHAVQMWPTPTVCGNYQHKGNMIGLATAVRMCSVEKKPGQLSPMWVEWLMGYRIGHTELNAWATQWFRSKSEKPLKNSQD